MKPHPPHLIDAKGAAEMLGVALKTVRKLTQARRISCVRLSRRCVRYDPAALAEWIEQRTVKAITRK
ncbi:helix-turn-helix transcriptional regulator [Haloferula sp. A504]|uniref:helix-turn-helix transcriptional regulator n=1 Tax=Haloferula sp. A504 TaxID=3373601 RepID=UPI0031C67938|nr:helix-turn-helix domain-containing protein [Verrucomicrobiaceae bacterium E54]